MLGAHASFGIAMSDKRDKYARFMLGSLDPLFGCVLTFHNRSVIRMRGITEAIARSKPTAAGDVSASCGVVAGAAPLPSTHCLTVHVYMHKRGYLCPTG